NHAVKNANIAVPDRRITAIVGPSGCGKSTLLKACNRLLDDDDNVRVSGSVLVDGEDIYQPGRDVTEIRKKMGLLSQKPYPLPMSIYDNVAFGPRIQGVRDRRILDEVVERYLIMAGLWEEVRDRLKAPASRLSIGQQQRLCLARGLAVEPEIILADEPTSALDPISSAKIEEGFQTLKEHYTIIIVTHVLRQAKRLADYAVYMYLGEIVEHGPARELFDNPREKSTREYMHGVIS
ncbi:MAG: phosphate ABC transporter ATP-binding protein, partial [Chrysiogenales bacterium]